MDLDLLTIANRASLSYDIKTSITNTKDRLSAIKAIVDKVENSDVFSKEEKKQEREFSIIGMVSILEQHLNDMLYRIYVSFPTKLGKKQFEIADLVEKGSLLELFYDKATQRVLDLAYGKFDRFMSVFFDVYDIKTQIDQELIGDINEIKCTRDCLIHSKGKSNALYLSKAGSKARVSGKGESLKTDYAYFVESIDNVTSLITNLEALIPKKYKESNRAYIFKQMWEATCLNERVKFEKAWKITSPDMVRPTDITENYGFSSTEMVVYNLFRNAYGGHDEYPVDFAFYFERWEPSSNEYQISMSWLNNQFYF